MDALDYWRLCDEFTVTQAALLIVGEDPGPVESYVDDWEPHKQPTGYRAARHALMTAVRMKKMRATIAHRAEDYSYAQPIAEIIDDPSSHDILVCSAKAMVDGKGAVRSEFGEMKFWLIGREPDWRKTTISRVEIVVWLQDRGILNSFFTPREVGADYLNRDDSRYAPKLAAAVRAWIATRDPALINGKSPKNSLTKWLNEHAAEFGLCDDDGTPNRTGIEQCAAVANWNPEGGAPKTPSR